MGEPRTQPRRHENPPLKPSPRPPEKLIRASTCTARGREPWIISQSRDAIFCYDYDAPISTSLGARHDSPGSVQLEIERRPDRVVFAIIDDGVGFDVEAAMSLASSSDSLGLLSMSERARLVGGVLHIIQSSGRARQLKSNYHFCPASWNSSRNKLHSQWDRSEYFSSMIIR